MRTTVLVLLLTGIAWAEPELHIQVDKSTLPMVRFDKDGKGTKPEAKPLAPLPTTHGEQMQGTMYSRYPWWGGYESGYNYSIDPTGPRGPWHGGGGGARTPGGYGPWGMWP